MNVSVATSPANHVTVQAAAGTGKTWLLVNRIVRLLLEGVEPDAILAVTFTRKAAAEMQQRIMETLWQLLTDDDAGVHRRLRAMGIHSPESELIQARNLYEKLLDHEHRLRTTTFHAFCQELLRRFPFDADVPAGFELVESTIELEAAAWQALAKKLTAHPDGDLAQAMDTLLKSCGGLHNTRQALDSFLHHRSDWWAYTEDKADPYTHARTALEETLGIGADQTPASGLLNDVCFHRQLQDYMTVLEMQQTKTSLAHLARLRRVLPDTAGPEAFELLRPVFLTAKNEPRTFRQTKRLASLVGQDASNHYARLHEELSTAMLETLEKQRAQNTLRTTLAWYTCGMRLLQHYQTHKQARGLVDFADLEWKAYRLFTRSGNAEWIQYKLDQRIEHVLVDEFQDTNPTQWRLLLPLLEEIIAGDPERCRSVFLVGDSKQSIYRFRRADPRLLNCAHEWLSTKARAENVSQHRSWRSAPAIITFVNLVFSEGPAGTLLHGFRDHETHRQELWGHAELLPLIPLSEETPRDPATTLRNPLREPRTVAEDLRHRREAEQLATRIEELIGQPIGPPAAPRPLDYGDIIILLRDRAHAQAYEDALRHGEIPYAGAGRGTLLECLEVRDLLDLLQVLTAPYDDLALAAVLRSPIFSCASEALIVLAETDTQRDWLERLYGLAPELPAAHPLGRAARLLRRWSMLVDHVPVHDLIDRIFNEGDLLNRYTAAAPPHLRQRVESNLIRFIELALEMDSGRYPSLSRFLNQLIGLRKHPNAAPNEPPAADGQRVRIMTIHAAKGLEAPVVFLADTARPPRNTLAYQAHVDWPMATNRPRGFHLVGKQGDLDGATRALTARVREEEAREQTNLLYVALTRAQQMLFVSGCETRQGDRGWYGMLEEALETVVTPQEGFHIERIPAANGVSVFNTCGRIVNGRRPPPGAPAIKASTTSAVDPALSRPLAPGPAPVAPNPSTGEPAANSAPGRKEIPFAAGVGNGAEDNDETARQRGLLIHTMLEHLSGPTERDGIERRLRTMFAATAPADLFAACWQEAYRVLESPKFAELFNPAAYRRAFNEMPILYRQNGAEVYGVIDRLVIYENEIVILDYKTHAHARAENIQLLAAAHAEQMRLYTAGVRKMFPDKTVRPVLLFTACGETVELNCLFAEEDK